MYYHHYIFRVDFGPILRTQSLGFGVISKKLWPLFIVCVSVPKRPREEYDFDLAQSVFTEVYCTELLLHANKSKDLLLLLSVFSAFD